MADTVQDWLKISRKDLLTAKALFELKNELFLDAIVFHSQQSAEKVLKAYLKFLGVKFPKIHDIKTLGTLIKDPNTYIIKKVFKAHRLSHYVTRYRYPSEADQELTEEEIVEAIQIASDTYLYFRSKIDE